MLRETLHLTLAFIGNAAPAQVSSLRRAAGRVRVAPFDVLLDRLGWWPHHRIVWAGGHETPSCQRRLFEGLAAELQAAGFPSDPRPYFPHVTLLRNANSGLLPAVEGPVCWRAASFSLVASERSATGARYRNIECWPLRESD